MEGARGSSAQQALLGSWLDPWRMPTPCAARPHQSGTPEIRQTAFQPDQLTDSPDGGDAVRVARHVAFKPLQRAIVLRATRIIPKGSITDMCLTLQGGSGSRTA